MRESGSDKNFMIKIENMNYLKENDTLRKSIEMLNQESADCNMVGVSNIVPVVKRNKVIGIFTSSMMSELIISDTDKLKNAKNTVGSFVQKKVTDAIEFPDPKRIQFAKEDDSLEKIEQIFKNNPVLYAVYITVTGDMNGEIKGMIRNYVYMK